MSAAGLIATLYICNAPFGYTLRACTGHTANLPSELLFCKELDSYPFKFFCRTVYTLYASIK